MEIYEVSGSAADKLRKVVEEGLGEEEAKNVRVESSDKSVTITYAVGGSGPVSFTIDLEEAEDGQVMFNPEQLEALRQKIAEDFGVSFDFGGLDEDTVTGIVQDSINEFVEKYGYKMFSNTYLCIFSILRIIQDCAEKLKKAATEARESQRNTEIELIKNQAAQQKSAALAGFCASVAVAFAQSAIDVVAGKVQKNAVSAQDNAINENPAVQTAKEISENTRLLNDPAQADIAMQKAGESLEDPTQRAEIIEQLGGYGEMDLEKLSETPRGKLEMTFDELKNPKEETPKPEKTSENETPKAETPEGKTPTEEDFKKQKEEYLKKLDAGVEKYQTKYEQANKEYQRELGKKNPDQQKLGELKDKCETARKEYVFANATRTAAIANGPGGEPLLDEDGREGLIEKAEVAVEDAKIVAANSPEVKALGDKEVNAQTIAKCMDAVNTLLASIPQLVHEMMVENVTLKQAEAKAAESGTEQAQTVVDSTKELQKKVLVLSGTLPDSNRRSSEIKA